MDECRKIKLRQVAKMKESQTTGRVFQAARDRKALADSKELSGSVRPEVHRETGQRAESHLHDALRPAAE